MDALAALGTLLALPALAGINAYATILTVGLLLRSDLLTHPLFRDPAFAMLAEDWVLVSAGALYLLEFLADKIPAVDHVWDVVHTFVRPPVGALLALAGMGAIDPDAGLPALVVAALLGGGAAAATHLTKATTRVVSTNLSLGSANWLVSLLEDLVAIGGAAAALVAPAAAGLAALAFLLVFLALFPRVVRLLIGVARRVGAATRALTGRPAGDPLREPVPADVERAFGAAGGRGPLEVALPVLLGRFGGRGGGWLLATPSHLACLARRRGRPRGEVLPVGEVTAPVVRRGLLSDALVIGTPGGAVRVTLLREPGRQAEAVAARLAALAAAARAAPRQVAGTGRP
jgi:hypothetical protein